MNRKVIYIISAVLICLCFASCASANNKTVPGTYTDSAAATVTFSADRTYSGNINGVSVSGEWKYGSSKITVLDGNNSFNGIALILIPSGESDRLDAVVYTVSSGQVRLQLNGTVYTKQ